MWNCFPDKPGSFGQEEGINGYDRFLFHSDFNTDNRLLSYDKMDTEGKKTATDFFPKSFFLEKLTIFWEYPTSWILLSAELTSCML